MIQERGKCKRERNSWGRNIVGRKNSEAFEKVNKQKWMNCFHCVYLRCILLHITLSCKYIHLLILCGIKWINKELGEKGEEFVHLGSVLIGFWAALLFTHNSINAGSYQGSRGFRQFPMHYWQGSCRPLVTPIPTSHSPTHCSLSSPASSLFTPMFFLKLCPFPISLQISLLSFNFFI